MRLEQHDIVTLDEAETIDSLTKKLGHLLVNQKLRLTTAESCTGGKLASALCAAEDTPSFYGVGYVTFTDEAKAKILRVQRHSLLPNIPPSAKRSLLKWHRALRIRLRSISA